MLKLKQLLYSDLARQYELEGRSDERPTLFGFVCRLPHPRFLPIVLCRGSKWAMLHGVPVVPKLLTYLNILLFGLEVSPRCVIGPGIFFPHTSGTVIGASRIGNKAIVFQGVTLGAKELDMVFDSALRPEVGDNVILGAGCKVLGGITIGDNVTIGANSVVVDSVQPNTTVAGIPAREIVSTARGSR
jgi:serine O-acetyltransferase